MLTQFFEIAADYGLSVAFMIITMTVAYKFFRQQLREKDSIIRKKDEQIQELNHEIIRLSRENIETLNNLATIIQANLYESERKIYPSGNNRADQGTAAQ